MWVIVLSHWDVCRKSSKRAFVHACVRACVHPCMHPFMHVCKYIHAYVRAFLFDFARMHARVRLCVCVYVYVCTHTHTHTHTQTCRSMYACVYVYRWGPCDVGIQHSFPGYARISFAKVISCTRLRHPVCVHIDVIRAGTIALFPWVCSPHLCFFLSSPAPPPPFFSPVYEEGASIAHVDCPPLTTKNKCRYVSVYVNCMYDTKYVCMYFL